MIKLLILLSFCSCATVKEEIMVGKSFDEIEVAADERCDGLYSVNGRALDLLTMEYQMLVMCK